MHSFSDFPPDLWITFAYFASFARDAFRSLFDFAAPKGPCLPGEVPGRRVVTEESNSTQNGRKFSRRGAELAEKSSEHILD